MLVDIIEELYANAVQTLEAEITLSREDKLMLHNRYKRALDMGIMELGSDYPEIKLVLLEAKGIEDNRIDQIDKECNKQNTEKLVDEEVNNNGFMTEIESTMIKVCDVRLDSLIGLNVAKEALRQSLIYPIKCPQFYTDFRKPHRRMLLYGPPGTGKTKLAQAIASEIKAPFYSLSSSNLLSKWVGESEKIISTIFNHARGQTTPSIIFIDEIDGLCRRRTSGEDEATRRVKTELLRHMDGITSINKNGKKQSPFFLLCATNTPWDLDEAFLRRFQLRIYIPLPTFEDRIEIFRQYLGPSDHHQITEAQLRILSESTDGFSACDIENLIGAAHHEPIRKMFLAPYFRKSKKTPNAYEHCCPSRESELKDEQFITSNNIILQPLCLADILHLRAKTNKSVSKESILEYTRFAGKS